MTQKWNAPGLLRIRCGCGAAAISLGLAVAGPVRAAGAGPVRAAGAGPVSARPQLRLGMVIDGPWSRNSEIRDLFTGEISELLGRDYHVTLERGALRVGDWSYAGVDRAIAESLADDGVDVLLAMGPIASHVASTRGPLPKPTIAPFVLDIELQGLPFENGTSGVHNLSYLTASSNFEHQLRMFHEIYPFTRLAVLSNPAYSKIIKGLRLQQMQDLGRELGFEVRQAATLEGGRAAIAALPPGTDAVFVTPLLHLEAEAFDQLVEGLRDRKLPSFSVMGSDEVERGLLAGLTPESDWQRKARRVALNIQRILRGEEAGTLAVEFELRERLAINMATARAIDVYPSWDIMTEAVLLHEKEKSVARVWTMNGIVREAMTANLSILAEKRAVAAGREDITRARARLRPQVSVGAVGRIIDQDRAASSFGSAPQRSLDASAVFTQLIYSEPVHADVAIQRGLQRAREATERELRLDVVQQVVAAYLDVLRAQTLEDISKENLKLTRSNLELAQIRRSIGSSGPGEVYRWESEVATDRSEVIAASARRNVAELQLNRLLDRPGEESFATDDMTVEDLAFVTADARLTPYIDDKWSFRQFRDFMVDEALEGSPELEQLDAAIEIQERILRSSRHAYWSPTLAASGELGHNLTRGGAGSTFSGGPTTVAETPDDTTWSLGLSLSFDAFKGGQKGAELRRAAEELERLRLSWRVTEDLVEQRARAAMHLTGASYASIGLSRAAADAADKNLDLVKDAYKRGAVSILDLLDAQNSALVARSVAANAVYDFAKDVNDIERAIGVYRLLRTEVESDAFFARLTAYMERVESER